LRFAICDLRFVIVICDQRLVLWREPCEVRVMI